MLHRSRLSYALYYATKRIASWLVVFVGIESGLSRLPQKDNLGWFYSFLQWQANEHAWWLILASTAIIGACIHSQKLIGSPEVWDVLHALLCGTQSLVFGNVGYEVIDYHRVTLFRCRCYRNKLDIFGMIRQLFQCKPRWLVPVIRSGHTSQKTKAYFSIGGSESECLGVAGKCWFRNQIVSVWNLPDLHNGLTETKILEYARDSYAYPELIKNRLPRARSILAVPVQLKQELWGVLVFDSRNPDQINRTNVDKLCGMLTGHLGKMIEKIL